VEAEARGRQGRRWEQRRGRGRREGEREERKGGDKVVVGLLGCWAALMGLFSNSGFSGSLFFLFF